MLAIGRKFGESIIINNNITVMVARKNGGNIVLAIDAPKDIPIHRKEIWEQIEREKKQ